MLASTTLSFETWGGVTPTPPPLAKVAKYGKQSRVNIYRFAIQPCQDTLFYVCTKLSSLFFCVHLYLCNEFTENLALTIEVDILDMMLEWMDMDGSQNSGNGYGRIWISSIFCVDIDGYEFTYFFLCIWTDMDFKKPHPCQSLVWTMSVDWFGLQPWRNKEV